MIFTKIDIDKWSQSYDSLTYPETIYDELVIKGNTHPDKIALMGAWKTASLRINNNIDNPIYTDANGNKYCFTKRWKPSAPVGYDVWHDVSANINDIDIRVPEHLPKNKPELLEQLISRDGFGNVWGLFVLHCIRPSTFPLYDQHVYRAFRYIESDGNEIRNLAPKSWNEYINYSLFFRKLAKDRKVDSTILDRALWSYGKHIKLISSTKQKTSEVK